MRVAIVINTSWNIYNFRRGLIKALQERGVEVVAIAPKDDFTDKLKALGCSIETVSIENRGANPVKDLGLFFRFLLLYRRVKPDYILHYTIKPNTYGTFAAALLGIPCISNVSGLGTTFIRKGLILRIAKALYWTAFRFPKRVFFQNKDDLELFVDLGLIKRTRTGLLPGSGIDLVAYQPVQNYAGGLFKFVVVARLLVDKGIREYAMAAKLLKEKGFQFEANLVGFFDRVSPYNISSTELEMWQQNGYINYLGESKDVRVEIGKSDCVVLPSYREGTPRSLLEAMAMSKPIITTNVPGCKEVVEDGKNGFSCEAQSEESLAAAMEKMLRLSQEQLLTMGAKGRLIAENRYDERIVVGRYLEEIFGKEVSN